MATEKPVTELDYKLKALRTDPLMGRLFFVMAIAMAGNMLTGGLIDRLVARHHTWFECTILGVLSLIIQCLIRHRLTFVALTLSTLYVGGAISLWYDLTGLERPPADQYTGLALVASLLLIAITFAAMNAGNKRQRERLEAHVPG
ncbi:MAG TPA: hypothetical protein VG820_04160 [Fimbriimonadaceae bacterium]|nr:hypothetical protein [Fimbriimonadaceae bacterium]